MIQYVKSGKHAGVAKKPRYARNRRMPPKRQITTETIRRLMYKASETKKQYAYQAPVQFNSTISGLSDLYSVIHQSNKEQAATPA